MQLESSLKKIQYAIATLGFIGFLPYAPGTFGTATAFIITILLRPDDVWLLLVLPLIFLLGLQASSQAEKMLGKDSGHIVIDEFCCYLVSVLFIPKTPGYLITAFILFRIFDILKPPPIGKIEEVVTGGTGIMLDDILAGIYANACLQVWRYLSL